MIEKWVGLGAVVAVVVSACGGTIIIDSGTGASTSSTSSSSIASVGTGHGGSIGTGYGGNTTVTTGYGGYQATTTTGYGGDGVGTGCGWSASGGCTYATTGYPTGYATATSSSSSGGIELQCPGTAPTAGGHCEGEDGSMCTYGGSVNPACRDQWACYGNQWQHQMTDCENTPPSQCPGSLPTSTTTCAATGDVCIYQDTICFCGCIGGFCPDPPTWSCTPPPGDCPAVAPNSGASCPSEDYSSTCSYGVQCTNTAAVVACENNVWEWTTPEICGI